MKLIDIHTHLSCPDYDNDRKEVLERALSTCDYLIDIGAGTSPDAFHRARKFAEENERVFFTAGVHPHDAETLGVNETIRSEIESLVQHPKCVAIGECGLDYYYEHSKPEIQKDVFRWHIALAKKTALPLMIHTRDAESDTMDLLKDYQGKAVFHCFTGTQELADFGIQKNFMISFSGIITFKNAGNLRDVFLKTPDGRFVIETDAPYLAPVPMRGKRNESAFIAHTARFLSNLRQMPENDFALLTKKATLELFSKLPHLPHSNENTQ